MCSEFYQWAALRCDFLVLAAFPLWNARTCLRRANDYAASNINIHDLQCKRSRCNGRDTLHGHAREPLSECLLCMLAGVTSPAKAACLACLCRARLLQSSGPRFLTMATSCSTAGRAGGPLAIHCTCKSGVLPHLSLPGMFSNAHVAGALCAAREDRKRLWQSETREACPGAAQVEP